MCVLYKQYKASPFLEEARICPEECTFSFREEVLRTEYSKYVTRRIRSTWRWSPPSSTVACAFPSKNTRKILTGRDTGIFHRPLIYYTRYAISIISTKNANDDHNRRIFPGGRRDISADSAPQFIHRVNSCVVGWRSSRYPCGNWKMQMICLALLLIR